jgi:hypothetical protein
VQWAEVPGPAAGGGVVIDVAAAGVSFADLLQTSVAPDLTLGTVDPVKFDAQAGGHKLEDLIQVNGRAAGAPGHAGAVPRRGHIVLTALSMPASHWAERAGRAGQPGCHTAAANPGAAPAEPATVGAA